MPLGPHSGLYRIDYVGMLVDQIAEFDASTYRNSLRRRTHHNLVKCVFHTLGTKRMLEHFGISMNLCIRIAASRVQRTIARGHGGNILHARGHGGQQRRHQRDFSRRIGKTRLAAGNQFVIAGLHELACACSELDTIELGQYCKHDNHVNHSPNSVAATPKVG